jgi:hypothetical protein
VLHDADPVKDHIRSGSMIAAYWSACGRPIVLPIASSIPDEPYAALDGAISAASDPRLATINEGQTLVNRKYDVICGR